MKKQFFVLMMAVLLAIPVAAFAMSHEDHGKKMDMDHGKEMAMEKGKKMGMDHGKKMGHDMDKMDHGDMKGMDHQGMSMDGKMIMLGTEVVEGVKGMFHLNDVQEQMAKHGMKQTHHIMVAFEDADGNAVESGIVAVKIEDPDEKVSDAIKMMGMDGHFGADIVLDKKGMYHFKIGTKLADGQKRTYHQHFENK